MLGGLVNFLPDGGTLPSLSPSPFPPSIGLVSQKLRSVWGCVPELVEQF